MTEVEIPMTIVVAGVTRSGMTMAMHMLHAGGIECAGSFPEFEDWASGAIPWNGCHGKAVKLVDANRQLPPPGNYIVINTTRDPRQQSRSIHKFLNIIGVESKCWKPYTDGVIRDNKTITNWAKRQTKYSIANFEFTIKNPLAAAKNIQKLIGIEMDVQAMADVVVDRTPLCYDGFIEKRWLG